MTSYNFSERVVATLKDLRNQSNNIEDSINSLPESYVTSISGTENEIEVSASSGSITISLPSTINANTTGNSSTSNSLATARDIEISGDLSGSASFDGSQNISINSTLSESGVSANSYGSSSEIPVIVVDSKGRITSASVTNVSIDGLPSQSGKNGYFLTTNGSAASWQTITLGTNTDGNYVESVSASGSDIVVAGSGESASVTLGLSDSGVSASSYGSSSEIPVFSVDSKGRITSASVASVEGLPDQSENNGKYLTTNGTVASWGTLDLSSKADLESPSLTGTPTAPTASASTNTTQIATTAFVQTAVSNLVDSAPTTLNTLNELAAALGDDPNFATTISNSLGNKQPLDADLTAISGLSGTSGFLKKTAANTWILDTTAYTTNTGTVTSVGVSVPTGLSVSGTPVTTSGEIAISLASGYTIPTTSSLDAKANDSEVVHIAGTETITGSKTFSANLSLSNSAQLIFSTAAGTYIEATRVDTVDTMNIVANDILTFNTGLNERMRIQSNGRVGIGTNNPAYMLEVNGSFAATSKSFDIEHPTKENMRLRYGSLEGPENGVYVRGKSDSSTITLPDYWTGLVYEDSITVQLTPVGSHQNLYVEDIADNTVTVGGVEGEFFYFIQAERKDIDKLVVEYGS